MKHKIFIFLVLITSIISSCAPKKQPIEKQILKKWDFVSIKNTNGEKVKTIAEKDFMMISDNGLVKKFNYELQKENINAAGIWDLKDSTIYFTYDLKPSSIQIDSVVYSVVDNDPNLVYYFKDKEVIRQKQNELNVDKLTRAYKIIKLTEQELVIEENNVLYQFKYQQIGYGSVGFNFHSIWRGLLGLFVLVLIAFLFSENKKKIDWKLVITGLSIQFIFAVSILKISFVEKLFDNFSNFFVIILDFTKVGSTFVFGGLVQNVSSFGFIFAFQVLPTIVFFSALTSVLYYLGIIQKIVFVFAWLMKKVMRLSGAESLAASGNIFLGQTEAPLLIKPYIEKMTRSEIMCLMSGGMATIAGGVLAAYIGFLGGDNPAEQLFFAKHLLAASLMSAPAAIVAAKILVPETENFEEKLEVTTEKLGSNVLESITNGTVEGLKLAVNVGAMLIVFIAFIAMANYFFEDFIGEVFNLNPWVSEYSGGQYKSFSLQFILGLVLKPLAWVMGVTWADSALIGQLLGEKTILNEFVAYVSLGEMKAAGVFTEEKSIIMATYILCGFANFASIGIQIGGISTIAPSKKTLLSQLGFKALIGGTLASLFTAVVVGMII
jgi:concentrative nucleoside transporter, CNT family